MTVLDALGAEMIRHRGELIVVDRYIYRIRWSWIGRYIVEIYKEHPPGEVTYTRVPFDSPEHTRVVEGYRKILDERAEEQAAHWGM